MSSTGQFSLQNRVAQSVIDYVCSLHSRRRKALLKILTKSIPERVRDIAPTCPDLYKRFLLGCAEDIICNNEKESFGIAIVALGDGSDWKNNSQGCTFEHVQMTIARHTCISLVNHSGQIKMLQEFLCLLPTVWKHNGVELSNRIVQELTQVINGFGADASPQQYTFSKSYINKYNTLSCWNQVASWFLFQRSQLSRPLISTLASRGGKQSSMSSSSSSEILEKPKSEMTSIAKEKDQDLKLDNKDECVSASALREYYFMKVNESDEEGAWAKFLNKALDQ